MRQGGPDGTAEAVHEEVRGRGGPAGTDQRPDEAIGCRGSVGLSTLTRWIGRSGNRKPDPSLSSEQTELAAELKRLRRENEILRQERDILKRATVFFRPGGKSMRFALVGQAKEEFHVHRLCRVLGVSQSGYFVWKNRPASNRQRQDIVLLAHIRSSFALSNATYGSPRMTHELRDNGLTVGRRRTARLMRENGLVARRNAMSEVKAKRIVGEHRGGKQVRLQQLEASAPLLKQAP